MNNLNPRLHELTTKLVSIFIQNELLVLLPSEWNIHDPSPEFVSSCDKSLTRAICCNLTSRQKHWGQLELPRNSKSPCLPKSVALIGGLYTESGEKIPTGGASYRYLFFYPNYLKIHVWWRVFWWLVVCSLGQRREGLPWIHIRQQVSTCAPALTNPFTHL